MKKILILSLALAVSATAFAQGFNAKISSAEPKEPKFLLVSIATNNVAVKVGTNSTIVTRATFYGYKAVGTNTAPTANVATAYVGYVDTAGGSGVTATRPVMLDAITAGGSFTRAADGVKFDLANIYVLGGTNDDKVLVKYEQ